MSKLITKINNIRIPVKLFVSLLILTFLFGLIVFISIYDYAPVDYFYMVPTGEYILHNGIPHQHTNHILTIQTVIQQWLYCVYVYILHSIGQPAVVAAVALMILAISYVAYKLFKERNIACTTSMLTLPITATIAYGAILAYMNIRPEAITILLILIEILCIERYIRTTNAKHIYVLPILMLLEINLHGSMWPIHYIALLPYVAPNILPKFCKNSGLTKHHIKHLIIAVLLMTVAMFINPYGKDMPLYLINTYKAHTFNQIDIIELRSLPTFSLYGISICLVLLTTAILATKKHINISCIYAIVGYSTICATVGRNYLFFYIPVLYLTRELADIVEPTIESKFDIKKEANLITTIFLCCVIGGCIWITTIVTNNTDIIKNAGGPSEIIAYLNDHANKEDHIYTGMNSGSFLEYAGYQNIYFDSRPELYTFEINETKDILGEYMSFACWYNHQSVKSETEFSEYIDEYQFKYFVMDMEQWLQYQLDQHPETYRQIMQDNRYFLYEKIA